MWVAELACPHGHGFEGWFASRADFDQQRERGLVSCPQCGSHHIERRLSAPRLNLGAPQPEAPTTTTTPVRSAGAASPAAPSAPGEPALPQLLREMVASVLAATEDVGRQFADEARRIHHGDAPARAIRGQADAEQLEALRDEGVEVWSLPLPVELGSDEPRH